MFRTYTSFKATIHGPDDSFLKGLDKVWNQYSTWSKRLELHLTQPTTTSKSRWPLPMQIRSLIPWCHSTWPKFAQTPQQMSRHRSSLGLLMNRNYIQHNHLQKAKKEKRKWKRNTKSRQTSPYVYRWFRGVIYMPQVCTSPKHILNANLHSVYKRLVETHIWHYFLQKGTRDRLCPNGHHSIVWRHSV